MSETGPLTATAPVSLAALATGLQGNAHLLSVGDEALARAALEAARDVFDYGLLLENLSHPHMHPFIASISDEPAITLRSSTKTKPAQPAPPKPEEILPYTPLSGLTIDGLDAEQIWQQLELRNAGIVKVVGEVGPGEMDPDEMDLGSEESESESDGEMGSDEDMTIEEFERMMAERGESDSDGSDDGSESEDSESDGASDADEFDLRDSDDELDGVEGSDEDDEDDESGEDNEDDEDEGDLDEEDEDGLDDLDGSEAGASLAESDSEDAAPGPSRRKRHPTLDDNFFSIDDFNRMTEETEAGRLSSGKLGGDDDDEDIEDISQAMLSGVNEDEREYATMVELMKALMYGDFFAPPKSAPAPRPVKTAPPSGKIKGKGKEKAVQFEEEEEADASRGIMGRVKGDLFDSDDEVEEKNLSTHEKQQLALKEQIAELEAQAIGPKDWTLLGEASSRARPENSLLEENLDFEHAGKIVPVITEESVLSLEELIKKRILDNNFDSTVRVRAYEPTAFLPSRFLELQDTQSTKSLAQIYEEDYQAAASGTKVKDPRDEKLKKEHGEIDKLWEDICYKLDALSSLNFVPKQPKAQITTVDNLPTTTMESALPATSAASTMLAPEELFAPPTASALVNRTELTPEEKQKARGKARKSKAAERKALGDMAELYGKRKSVKEQKDDALKSLVKTGKGVTVVGKGGKEVDKARKRQADGEAVVHDSKRLKL